MNIHVLFLTYSILLLSSCNCFPQKKENTETSMIHRNKK